MDKSLSFTVRLKPIDEKNIRVIRDLSNLDTMKWPTRNAYIVEALDAFRDSEKAREERISNEVVNKISDEVREIVKSELNMFFMNLLGRAFSGYSADMGVENKMFGVNETITDRTESKEEEEFMNNLSDMLDRWNDD